MKNSMETFRYNNLHKDSIFYIKNYKSDILTKTNP